MLQGLIKRIAGSLKTQGIEKHDDLVEVPAEQQRVLAGHVVALFWAAHVVHHQSQHYNLSTALRQTSSGLLLGWIF